MRLILQCESFHLSFISQFSPGAGWSRTWEMESMGVNLSGKQAEKWRQIKGGANIVLWLKLLRMKVVLHFNHLYSTTIDNDKLVLLSRELDVIGLHVKLQSILAAIFSSYSFFYLLHWVHLRFGGRNKLGLLLKKKMIWSHFHILESMWALTECCMSFYEQSVPFWGPK